MDAEAESTKVPCSELAEGCGRAALKLSQDGPSSGAHLSPEHAEQRLLSGEQLMVWSCRVLNYVSKGAGRTALQRLHLLDPEPLFREFDAFADALRPFEFGPYRERGFLNRSELDVIPPMEIRVAEVTLKAEYVGAGHFASVFKISSSSGSCFALKIYYQRNAEDFSSGPWSETALGIYVTAHSVSNMPHLCLANPAGGWILTEFVDSNYQSSTPAGPTWADLGLRVYDDTGANEVLFGERRVRVDYGHIATNESEKLYIQRELRATLLKLRGAGCHVEPQAFLRLYRERPDYRKHLLFNLACLSREHRLPVLKKAFSDPEAEFLPLQDYLLNDVISAESTRELFDLLMTHPNPTYRAQGIFDVRKLSKEDANYLGENWYSRPEFLPFLIYLGEKQMCDSYAFPYFPSKRGKS